MSGTNDLEAYNKGYEDAMRQSAASVPAVNAPPPVSAPEPAGQPAPARRRRRGLGYNAQFALGWLIVFPLAFGTMAGFVGFLLGGVDGFWWGFGFFTLLCFAFALFAGAGVLVFRYWPIFLGLMIILLLVSKAT
jgi:hypothetical protein